MPKLLGPEELIFDLIIATHAHYDHFDIDAMPVMMSNGKSILITALDGRKECEKFNIPSERTVYLAEGDQYVYKNIIIKAVFCDHGINMPDAIGLMISITGKNIYITGDTSLHKEKAREFSKQNIDIMFAPINGAFGNLNENESVTLCEIVKPKIMVPCHFWNFAEQGGDPHKFMQEISNRLPQQKYHIMSMGECILI